MLLMMRHSCSSGCSHGHKIQANFSALRASLPRHRNLRWYPYLPSPLSNICRSKPRSTELDSDDFLLFVAGVRAARWHGPGVGACLVPRDYHQRPPRVQQRSSSPAAASAAAANKRQAQAQALYKHKHEAPQPQAPSRCYTAHRQQQQAAGSYMPHIIAHDMACNNTTWCCNL
jgi:hypothetical protein